jgi:hypothetical protein
MAFGLTQPLTEMSTRNFHGVKGRPARKTDNLTVICESIVKKMWEPRPLTTLWASTACYRDGFTFFHFEIPEGTESDVRILVEVFVKLYPAMFPSMAEAT